MKPALRDAFIHANTLIDTPPLCPEIRLHMTTEICPIWEATEEVMARIGLEPPYWAFAWPGGQALARHILDFPELVAGKKVLDFAAGNGLIAIAAAHSGASRVDAADIDAFAIQAMHLNAALNDATIFPTALDMIGRDEGWDVVLTGDICYEKSLSERVVAWLHRLAARGALVLMGDPGRTYLPITGLTPLARYQVRTSLELEDREMREGVVWRVI